MSDDNEDCELIGYKKPPIRTRWAKGQCGNPQKRRSTLVETETEMIERHLMSRFTYVGEDGTRRSITKINAIMQRLVSDSLKGDIAAVRTLQKYKHFARQNADSLLEVEFEDNNSACALLATKDEGQ